MSWQSQPITVSIMGGQVLELREAIQAIWQASQDQTQTEIQRGANVNQAIYDAYLLLPEDMRQGVPPAKAVTRTEPFEDLLG